MFIGFNVDANTAGQQKRNRNNMEPPLRQFLVEY